MLRKDATQYEKVSCAGRHWAASRTQHTGSTAAYTTANLISGLKVKHGKRSPETFGTPRRKGGRRSDTAQSNSLVDGSGSGSEAKTDDRNDLRCGLFEFATLSSCQLNVTG